MLLSSNLYFFASFSQLLAVLGNSSGSILIGEYLTNGGDAGGWGRNARMLLERNQEAERRDEAPTTESDKLKKIYKGGA